MRWILMTAALCVSSQSQATTRWIGTSGCDDSAGGTRTTRPFCTFKIALAATRAGDKLLFNSGTYTTPIVIQKSGSATAPIVIAAAPDARVVIDASDARLFDRGIVSIADAGYITLSGLTIRNSSYYGVLVSAAQHVTLDTLTVENTHHGGIVIDEGSANVTLRDSVVRKTNQAGSSAIHEAVTISNVKHFRVQNNRVEDAGEESIDVKDGSSHGIIVGNTVTRSASVGIYLNHATDITVSDNTVRGVKHGSGIQLATGDKARGDTTNSNDIFRNTIVGCAQNGIEFWSTSSNEMHNNRIYNNVISQNAHFGIRVRLARQTTIVNNILTKNAHGGIGMRPADVGKQMRISHNLWHENGVGAATTGDDNVIGDPRFVDAERGNFQLKRGSPAIDSGTEMSLNSNGPQDIGRFEFGATTPTPPDTPADGGSADSTSGPNNSDSSQAQHATNAGCSLGSSSPRAPSPTWTIPLLALLLARRTR